MGQTQNLEKMMSLYFQSLLEERGLSFTLESEHSYLKILFFIMDLQSIMYFYIMDMLLF